MDSDAGATGISTKDAVSIVGLLCGRLVDGERAGCGECARYCSSVNKGVDTVFHLAGFAHDLRDASELEGEYRKVNVDATVRLAELAVRAGVKRFVFVSSVKAVSRVRLSLLWLLQGQECLFSPNA
jgi:nucleoside-diphosphate-sugar epimerase